MEILRNINRCLKFFTCSKYYFLLALLVHVPAYADYAVTIAQNLAPASPPINTTFSYTANVSLVPNTAPPVGTTTIKITIPAGLVLASYNTAPISFGTTNCSSSAANLTKPTIITCVAPAGFSSSVTFTLPVQTATVGIYIARATANESGTTVTVAATATTTVVAGTPDLKVAMAQPLPGLQENGLSEIPTTIQNVGGQDTQTTLKLTMSGDTTTLGTNFIVPMKFLRNADSWSCLRIAPGIVCTSDAVIKANNANPIVLKLPVTAKVGLANTNPGFKVTLDQLPFEVDAIAGNNTVTMTAAATVVVAQNNIAGNNAATHPWTLFNRTEYGPDILVASNFPKFRLPLPNLTHSMYTRDGTNINGATAMNMDYKTIKQQILPPGFPPTSVYAYGDPNDAYSFSYPGATILAQKTTRALAPKNTINMTNTNTLISTTADNLLIGSVDHTIDGTYFGSLRYEGAGNPGLQPNVRNVTHLHGNTHPLEYSDGFPEAWRDNSRDVNGNPNSQINKHPMLSPDTLLGDLNNPPAPYLYRNEEEASMLWYHDHTIGMTRLNVYAGLAGAYVVRDSNEKNLTTYTTTTPPVLPSGRYEVPLILQDKDFKVTGDLAYPNRDPNVQNTVPPTTLTTPLQAIDPTTGKLKFDAAGKPIIAVNDATDSKGIPLPCLSPEQTAGQVMVVNGVAWPFLEVEPRKYRFRILNGSSAKTYLLHISNSSPATIIPPSVPLLTVIGTDGGFLNSPVANLDSFLIAPGERYDVIVDFSNMPNAATFDLEDYTVRVPYAGQVPAGARGANLRKLMRFTVTLPLSNVPNATVDAATNLRPNNPIAAYPEPVLAARKRALLLGETLDEYSRTKPILGTVTGGYMGMMDSITETPTAGTLEQWDLYNTTKDAHPIHLHDTVFQVVERQAFNAVIDSKTGVLSDICFTDADRLSNGVIAKCNYTVHPVSAIVTPSSTSPYENGFKDTVIAPPDPSNRNQKGPNPSAQIVFGMRTRIRMKFNEIGLFVWHCHILDHEDHDMMRRMRVN